MARMTQAYRLDRGGLIDRSQRLPFTFDGIQYEGFAGDTLASALLANGVRVVARSFKYHRPRGIFSCGPEEPSALVNVGTDDRSTPNTRATQVWLESGLITRSQNRWPSLRWDIGAVAGVFSPFLGAGFYYKTFMKPRSLWPLYEHAIRSVAGMGRSPTRPDPDHYDKEYQYCECLIVGLGPAGIAAALAASQSGTQRIILLDSDRLAGGSLLFNRATIDGEDGAHWAKRSLATLTDRANVTVCLRTTAFGYYDDNLIAAVEESPTGTTIRQRIRWIRAARVIVATGAHERPLVFSGNDRPGILLAGAARAYLNRFAVTPGRRVAILTNNDSSYALARDLTDAGISVAALIDVRDQAVDDDGIPIRSGYSVTKTWGRSALRGIRIESNRADARSEDIACDTLCVSGGWTPAIQLHAHAQGAIHFNAALGAFVPGEAVRPHVSVGAAAGSMSTNDALKQGWRAGGGIGPGPHGKDSAQPADKLIPIRQRIGRAKAFVDLQNDVTAADVRNAAHEGFDSVEHLKRYTTLGMGTDQGKTSNINGLGLLAQVTDRPITSLGVTTFRPPYVPVTLGALAGHHRGRHFAPTRRSPLHEAHQQANALFVEAGLWLRPRCYPRPGESPQQATNREVRTVRTSVGMVDVSTLGKIDLQGPDCAEFLERIYCNRWRSLAIGKARYGLMLREDGIVLDDGTTSRLGPDHYFMTTSTAHAGKVMSHLEYCLQVLWPELDVHAVSVTEQWCAIAVAGPTSRTVLEQVLDIELDNDALPYLGARTTAFAGQQARILRVSFSGERSYELYVPARLGPILWRQLLAAGRQFCLTPYGTDALTVLRVEKGHVAGAEIDGRTTPADLGLGKLCSTESYYIGRRLGERLGLRDPSRPALVGLSPVDTSQSLRAGSQLVRPPDFTESLGHTTTAIFSATLGHSIALALVSGGQSRKGQELLALDLLRGEQVRVRVVDPIFVDPTGEHVRG
jgi:heterotetrameric sarcosine oxidase alpha subunit